MDYVSLTRRVARSGLACLLLSLVSSASGCLGSLGELGERTFYYGCVDASDPYCDHDSCVSLGLSWCGALESHRQGIPAAIARGASFSVTAPRFQGYSDQVVSASPAMVSGVTGSFTAHQIGRVALLVKRSGWVLDFIYLQIEAPTSIRLTRVDSLGQTGTQPLRLAVGEEAWIRAVPFSIRGSSLSGALSCGWYVDSSGGGGVAITSNAQDNLIRIVGTNVGTARLSVALGEITSWMDVIVGEPCMGECCVETGCDASDPARQCCPDGFGQVLECVGGVGGPTGSCALPCQSGEDCYWSTECGAEYWGICAWVPCGAPEAGAPGVLEGTCQVGGAPGICVGLTRDDPQKTLGRCVEAGLLQAGEECLVADESFVLPRWVSWCDQGLCLGAPGSTIGRCVGLCDWENHYDVAFGSVDASMILLPCPPSTNCASSAHIASENGLWQPGLSLCVPTWETDPVKGATVCSLVTGGLLISPSQSCVVAMGEAEAECLPAGGGSSYSPEALGTLLGACALPTWAPNLEVWDDCGDATALCPPRTRCEGEGALLGGVTSSRRCLPYCDVEAPETGDASCLGVVQERNPAAQVHGSLSCISLSLAYDDPLHGLWGAYDVAPTRLGLCQVQP